MRRLVLILIVLALSIVTYGQNDTERWMKDPSSALNDAETAFSNGDYERTIKLVKIYQSLSMKKDGEDLLSKAQECQQLLEKAKHFEEQGESSSANQYYNRILSLNPNDKIAKRALDSEYAKKGYMEITGITFANVTNDNSILNDYGNALYKEDIRFIKPKVFYNGLSSENKSLELLFKIYGPNGTLSSGSSSPDGYTWKETITLFPGKSKSFVALGWGNKDGGTYSAGTHRFEVWYDGNRLYSTSFEVKERSNALSRGEWHSQMRKVMDNASQTYDNGAYRGQLDGSTRSGIGTYWWNNGNSYYWGHWKGGEKNGTAIYIVTKEGSFVKNCPDCMFYVGPFNNGQKSGKGTCYDRFGNLIYYGNFSADSPTETYPSSGYNEYKFECIEYNNGNKYFGETKNGKRNGEGIYMWSNGGSWFGPWTDGQRNGYGLYMPYSGSVQYGQWFGDVMAPTQTVLTKNNQVYCDGVYHGPHWEYNYKQTALYEGLGDQFNRNFFSISLDYYIIPSDDGYDSKWSDNNNIIMLDCSYRAFGLILLNNTIYVKTNNGDNYFDTKIEFKCETWQHIDLVYNNGSLYINGQTLDIGKLNGPGDNVLSSVDFSGGRCFKGYIKNIIVKSN